MNADSKKVAGEHSPEPWRLVGNGEVVGVDNNTAAIIVADAKAEANARRIVACVNYCVGLDTAAMESYAKEGKGAASLMLTQHSRYLKAEADALKMLSALEKLSCMKLGMVADGIVDKAIAAVKGGAA